MAHKICGYKSKTKLLVSTDNIDHYILELKLIRAKVLLFPYKGYYEIGIWGTHILDLPQSSLAQDFEALWSPGIDCLLNQLIFGQFKFMLLKEIKILKVPFDSKMSLRKNISRNRVKGVKTA